MYQQIKSAQAYGGKLKWGGVSGFETVSVEYFCIRDVGWDKVGNLLWENVESVFFLCSVCITTSIP